VCLCCRAAARCPAPASGAEAPEAHVVSEYKGLARVFEFTEVFTLMILLMIPLVPITSAPSFHLAAFACSYAVLAEKQQCAAEQRQHAAPAAPAVHRPLPVAAGTSPAFSY